MAAFADLTGQRFGRLTVIAAAGHRATKTAWVCRCDCGTEIVAIGNNLKRRTRSCGCLNSERARVVHTTHGHGSRQRPDPTYSSWLAMKARCENPKSISYPRYGGSGVRICARWAHSFENFLQDMGERPADRTLDRINPNGNYEPGNCRWATHSEQRINRRVTA